MFIYYISKDLKYSQMTNRLYSHRTFNLLVVIVNNNWYEPEPSNEYKSTFSRNLETQLYNELGRDYGFPREVCSQP